MSAHQTSHISTAHRREPSGAVQRKLGRGLRLGPPYRHLFALTKTQMKLAMVILESPRESGCAMTPAQIAEAAECSVSKAAHDLTAMRENGWIEKEKRGRQPTFRFAPEYTWHSLCQPLRMRPARDTESHQACPAEPEPAETTLQPGDVESLRHPQPVTRTEYTNASNSAVTLRTVYNGDTCTVTLSNKREAAPVHLATVSVLKKALSCAELPKESADVIVCRTHDLGQWFHTQFGKTLDRPHRLKIEAELTAAPLSFAVSYLAAHIKSSDKSGWVPVLAREANAAWLAGERRAREEADRAAAAEVQAEADARAADRYAQAEADREAHLAAMPPDKMAIRRLEAQAWVLREHPDSVRKMSAKQMAQLVEARIRSQLREEWEETTGAP